MKATAAALGGHFILYGSIVGAVMWACYFTGRLVACRWIERND